MMAKRTDEPPRTDEHRREATKGKTERHVGRPLKTHAPGTEATIGVLMPAELKTKLQQHAVEAKRTLSAEAQLRLEESFKTSGRAGLLPDALKLAFGELGGVLLMIGVSMERSGRLAAWNATKDPDVWSTDSWMDNATAWDAAVKAANDVLEAAKPGGKVKDQAPPFEIRQMLTAYLDTPGGEAPVYAAEIQYILRPSTKKRMRSWAAGKCSAQEDKPAETGALSRE